MTEYGHKFIPEDQQKLLTQLPPGSEGWDKLYEWLKKDHPKFKTIVVDTISGLYQMCMDYVCTKHKWDHPADAPHGKGWNAVRQEFYDGINRIAHTAGSNKATLIMIDHSKEELVQTTTEDTVKVNCAMPGQARSVVLPVPDHIWFLGYAEKDPNDALKTRTSQRALFIAGSKNIEAGCRDPKVKIEVIMPLSKKDPYSQILNKLYGEQE